jgi:hypothetical protein
MFGLSEKVAAFVSLRLPVGMVAESSSKLRIFSWLVVFRSENLILSALPSCLLQFGQKVCLNTNVQLLTV